MQSHLAEAERDAELKRHPKPVPVLAEHSQRRNSSVRGGTGLLSVCPNTPLPDETACGALHPLHGGALKVPYAPK